MEAVALDEQVAELLIDMPETASTKVERRLSEYDAVVEMLSLLADRIAELIGTVAASRGIKPRKIPPAPRPVTALERLRKRRREQKHHALVARLLPGRSPAPALPPKRPALLPGRPAKPEPDRTRRSGWSP